jgi:hypothetical protein
MVGGNITYFEATIVRQTSIGKAIGQIVFKLLLVVWPIVTKLVFKLIWPVVILLIGIFLLLLPYVSNSQTYLANCHSTHWQMAICVIAYWAFCQIVFNLLFGQLSLNHCFLKLIWPVVILLIGSLVDIHLIIFANSQTYMACCHSIYRQMAICWIAYWHFDQIVFNLLFGQLSLNNCFKLIWPFVILLIGSLVDCCFLIFLTLRLIWPTVIIPTYIGSFVISVYYWYLVWFSFFVFQVTFDLFGQTVFCIRIFGWLSRYHFFPYPKLIWPIVIRPTDAWPIVGAMSFRRKIVNRKI